MVSEIVSQVCKYQCPLLGFVNRATVQLNIVALSVNIDRLFPIVDDLRRWDHSTVTYREVKEC